MINKPLYAIMLLFAVYCCHAQTSDQFSDGDFSTNPTWIGDDSLFQVNATFQLQSKGSTSKDISLATSVVYSSEMEWQCWVKFNLSPSTSNFCRYYLSSDGPNVKGSVNGYYIQFGGVTGSSDSITLYKQKGSTRTRIIAGRPATVSKSINAIRLKVYRDTAGNWELFSDTTGGYSFVLEGTGTDSELVNDGYAGIMVRYTTSNASNYFFDDMYAGPKIIDNKPPDVDSLFILSSTQLRLVFSEDVHPESALTLLNYNINNGIGSPVNIDFEAGKTNRLILELNKPLTNQSYELLASNIADKNGNTLTEQIIAFTYDHYNAAENDIVISEFFPDPSPSVGLPEKEFVELFNRTSTTITLTGWSLSDGTTTAILGNASIKPDSFIIMCASSSANDFKPFGDIVTVSSLPSLNNSSDQLILRDALAKVIHQMHYDLSWYDNTTKQDGGFTLEMHNPQQLCLDKQNFSASEDPSGGTPGSQNSHWSKLPDTSLPTLQSILVKDSLSLLLLFSERMDSLSLLASNILLNGNTVLNKSVSLSHDTLILQLVSSLIKNETELLSISNANDCSGNQMLPTSLSFTFFVPERARQHDVLITEIMADPDPSILLPNAEYIELYNRSHKFISLEGWMLSDGLSTATFPSIIIQPDSFVVLTTIPNIGKFTAISNVIGMSGFPSLGNDADALTLADETGKVIHYFTYTSAAYKDNVKKNGGWSLEMMDTKNPCAGDKNLAASISAKGGTPGFRNSAQQNNPDNSSPQLLKVYPTSHTQLLLQFSEPMDSLSLLALTHYQSALLPSLPSTIQLIAPDYTKVELSSNDSFQYQTIYRLLVDSIKDCAGNTIGAINYGDFGMPETPDSGDIAINEILFDPRGDESDFVEIVNRTDKMLDLKNVWLANADEQNQINDFYPVDSTGWLLFPKTYAVITESSSSLQSSYFTPQPKHIIQSNLPSYPNDAGSCILLNASGKRLDQFDYTDKMHFALLDTKDGVSLERIDFNRPTTDESNWTSASSTSGFGTPTYQNSQYAKDPKGIGVLRIDPEVFSPDGDGFNDNITFSYSLPEPGYVGNVYIYNAAGMMIKHLLRNEVLGTTGSFGWDGFTNSGEKALIGIYLYYFEAFNLNGDVVKAKSTLVVGAKL